ncbi:MAG: CBS domain-containing protein [Chloroflexi bacterium]|nr:MAG: CBS domain-containing protein [Chloroflexota bacterium]
MVKPSLESQLLQESVKALDLHDYIIVSKDTSVRETIELMRSKKQNCAFVVGEHTRLIGIVTDRDVLRKVVTKPETWDKPVTDIMTANPDSITGDATAQDAMALMDEHHYRNVPVVLEDGRVLGNVTHFAILCYLTEHFAEDVFNLPPDPENYASQRVGG